MLAETIQNALNEQLNREFYSSYLYLSMAAYFEGKNLFGSAQWMKVQAQEELGHALRIFDHVYERGGDVVLTAIDGPPTSWDSPLAAFQNALEHERKITGRIHKLVELAAAEHDHATHNFLQWFVAEQVEEEASVDVVVRKLTLAGDHVGALFIIDHELGARKS